MPYNSKDGGKGTKSHSDLSKDAVIISYIVATVLMSWETLGIAPIKTVTAEFNC